MSSISAKIAPRIRRHHRERRRKGNVLLEYSFYAMLIAVGLIAVYAIYQTTQSNSNKVAFIQEITQVQNKIRQTYNGQGSFANLANAALINAGGLPRNMISGTNLLHSYGGALTVAPATIAGVANNGFSITATNIPAEGCTGLVTQVLGNLFSVAAGGLTRAQNTTPPPFDPVTAATACASNSNTIVWTYQR
ncbi:type 4 pilus major pilin [Pseudovibrio ascidiaceicola]|uniref:type 4 pilus major pilin n=1 Tax=Pseudovibrio ascidiaceicola TaxID=285279 RepID=UPI003D36C0C1